MFILQKTSYPAGIGRHRVLLYSWQTALLAGSVTAPEEKPDTFLLSVSPAMGRLRALDAAPERPGPRYDDNRNLTVYLDRYPSLDAAAERIALLESFYSAALTDHGAAQRVLRAGKLQPTNAATDPTFGQSLRRALAEEVFSVLRAGKPVPFAQMAGRLFRPLANGLNVSYTEETERPADDKRDYLSVTHTYDGVARFIFINNGDDDFPTVIRQSYNENTGGYRQTYTGPGTMDNLRRHVFDWLTDAVREKAPVAETPALIVRADAADRAMVAAGDRKDAAQRATVKTPAGTPADAPRALLENVSKPVLVRAPFLRVIK